MMPVQIRVFFAYISGIRGFCREIAAKARRLIKHFFFFPVMVSITLHSAVLGSSAYDDDVLDIFSKILPRFVLMSSGKSTITKEKIDICVLHDKLDERPASSLIAKIDRNHPNGLKNYRLHATGAPYSNLGACENTQLIFMFDTDEKNIEKTIHFSRNHRILTISYDAGYLEKGVNASLFLGRKVTPYLNIDTLRKSGVEIDNTLVRISKIYSTEDGK